MNDKPALSTNTAPEAAKDVPPSAKLVLTVLVHEGPLTQSQLAEETMLPARTVRYALKQLEERDLVTSEISFMDARQSMYFLNDERFADMASQ